LFWKSWIFTRTLTGGKGTRSHRCSNENRQEDNHTCMSNKQTMGLCKSPSPTLTEEY
jgi:hypothetical protein